MHPLTRTVLATRRKFPTTREITGPPVSTPIIRFRFPQSTDHSDSQFFAPLNRMFYTIVAVSFLLYPRFAVCRIMHSLTRAMHTKAAKIPTTRVIIGPRISTPILRFGFPQSTLSDISAPFEIIGLILSSNLKFVIARSTSILTSTGTFAP